MLKEGDDKRDDNDVGSDIRDDADGNIGEASDYVGVDIDVINLDDVEDVFVDIDDDVYVVDVDDLLDDRFVEVEVVEALADVVVVVNLINMVVAEVMSDDDAAADDDLTVDAMDELLVGNDEDEDDVANVGNVVCEVSPVDVVVDVRVVAF